MSDILFDVQHLSHVFKLGKHAVIKAVDDEELRIILEKRYLNYEAWTDIADDLCVGVDNVYKLHKKALQKVKLPKSLQ